MITLATERLVRFLERRSSAPIVVVNSRQVERSGRLDPELYTWQALDALRAAPGRWGGDSVFFYGFDDLHALQLDAVETLCRAAGAEVTVSLTWEDGREALTTAGVLSARSSRGREGNQLRRRLQR